MFFSKRRLVHAMSYEVLLLVIIAILLSIFSSMSILEAGSLSLIMALLSVLWNMIFNHFFERWEKKHQFQRDIKIRLLHAVGFEGGLMLATIPIIAYMLQISLLQAVWLDLGLTLGIMVYTFVFQYFYDALELKYYPVKRSEDDDVLDQLC